MILYTNFSQKIQTFLPDTCPKLKDFLKVTYFLRSHQFSKSNENEYCMDPAIRDNNIIILRRVFPDLSDKLVQVICRQYISHKLEDVPQDDILKYMDIIREKTNRRAKKTKANIDYLTKNTKDSLKQSTQHQKNNLVVNKNMFNSNSKLKKSKTECEPEQEEEKSRKEGFTKNLSLEY